MNESIVVTFGADTSPMERAMKAIGLKTKEFGQSVAHSFKEIGSSLTAAFTVGAVIEAGRSIMEFAKHIRDVSEVTGASTDFVQGFSAVVSQTGGSSEKAEKALEKFTIKVGEARNGVAAAVGLFNQWQISLTNVNGTAKTTDELVLDVSDRLKEIKDPATQAAIASDFFGAKIGAVLVPALRAGREELEKMMASKSKMSAQDIEAMDRLVVGTEDMTRSVKIQGGTIIGFWSDIGEKIAHSTGKMWGFLKPWLQMGGLLRNVIDAGELYGELSVGNVGKYQGLRSKPGPKGVNGPAPFNTEFTSEKGELDRLKAEDKRDHDSAERSIAEAQKTAYTAAFSKLTLEQKINSVIADRARLMRIVDNRRESDSNRARALASFAQIQFNQLPELQAQLSPPPQVVDTSGNAYTRNTAAAVAAGQQRLSDWSTSHQGAIDAFSNRLRMVVPTIPTPRNTVQEQLADLNAQIRVLNARAAGTGGGVIISPRMG